MPTARHDAGTRQAGVGDAARAAARGDHRGGPPAAWPSTANRSPPSRSPARPASPKAPIFRVFADKDELLDAALDAALDQEQFERALRAIDPDAALRDAADRGDRADPAPRRRRVDPAVASQCQASRTGASADDRQSGARRSLRRAPPTASASSPLVAARRPAGPHHVTHPPDDRRRGIHGRRHRRHRPPRHRQPLPNETRRT